MHSSLAFVAHKFFWVFFDHIYKLTKSYVDSKIFYCTSRNTNKLYTKLFDTYFITTDPCDLW